ncbi:MAG: hypothetical protein ACJ8FY_00045 [Gemmataceae bacterium]
MRRLLSALAGGLVIFAFIGPLKAGRVEADPNHDYVLGPECGEWLICAATYKGPDGPNLAKQMVYHLRSQENLPAFVHVYHDEAGRQMQRDLDERARQMPGVRRKIIHIEDQFAVLIGGFKTIDSARKLLPDVKVLKAPQLKLSSGQVAQDIISVGEPTGGRDKMDIRRLPQSPFTLSFVARNPTISHEAADKVKFDPAWKKLNAEESYSLLECKKPYTLVVKQYCGASCIGPQNAPESTFLEKLGIGSGKSVDTLGAAYMNAHNLADALHKMKFDAYVLHTRGISYVTVGAFASADDAELKKMQEAFINSVKVDTKGVEAKLKDARALQSLQLMNPPMPMPVPRP